MQGTASEHLTVSSSGLKKSALLVRALGGHAAALWAELSSDEAERLKAELDQLPPNELGEQEALQSYIEAMRVGAGSKARSSEAQQTGLDGRKIAHLLRSENPQVVALAISMLPAKVAAQTLSGLPQDLASEALTRVIHIRDVHPAATRAVRAFLAQHAAIEEAQGAQGHERVARILDQMGSDAEQGLIAGLERAAPGAGEKVRALMFTFEDLAQLDAAGIQTILAYCDRSILVMALKGAPEHLVSTIFQNMTQRAGELLREDLDALGPVRRREVEAARAELLRTARQLAKSGDILRQQKDDELIE